VQASSDRAANVMRWSEGNTIDCCPRRLQCAEPAFAIDRRWPGAVSTHLKAVDTCCGSSKPRHPILANGELKTVMIHAVPCATLHP